MTVNVLLVLIVLAVVLARLKWRRCSRALLALALVLWLAVGCGPLPISLLARLQSALFDWALHPRMHVTTPNAKIAAYANQQLQVKNGVLIGIWDEAELGAIREKIGIKS